MGIKDRYRPAIPGAITWMNDKVEVNDSPILNRLEDRIPADARPAFQAARTGVRIETPNYVIVPSAIW